MHKEARLLALTELLPPWFLTHQRVLPWRGTGNPYDVWLSEIMLQQTRVEAVKGYFLRFREALPDIPALADCPEEKLLKLWEGLGYYSRVRNLQKCASVLCAEYGGKLPADHAALLRLPGIGPYTAGAIASIAFGIMVPAVDGNVLRVYARVCGDASDIALLETRKRVETDIRDAMLSAENAQGTFSPAVFNQALMELGAIVCVPNGAPLCAQCPVRTVCAAFREGRISELPVKTGKKPRKIEEKTVVLLQDGERFLLQKRPEKGLLAGLYEFPSLPGFLEEREVLSRVEAAGFDPVRIIRLPDEKHIFTHVEWRMRGYLVKLSAESRAGADVLQKEAEGRETPWLSAAHVFATTEETEAAYALPSAFSKTFMKFLNFHPELLRKD